MKLQENYSIRKIGDEYIVLLEEEQSSVNKALTLNETAVFLLEESKGLEISAQLWGKMLSQRFDVDFETACQDVESLINTFKEVGIIK